MGWGDLGSYGSAYSHTPNIDQLAAEGTRFTQFYAGAPICSPSRASLFTGQYSARSGINSFLANSADNLSRDNADSLSLDAPSMARAFQDSGYATGHFGKWHMGGGRDVGYAVNPTPGTNVAAPRVVEYGYDAVWTQFEGLGNRIINVVDYGGDANGVTVRPSAYMNGINQQSDARGTGGGLDQIVYLEREFNSTFMIDRAMEFIDNTRASNPNQPFFMNVWLDEVHTPHDPPAALKAKYNSLYPSLPADTRDYLAVLEYTDQQIGRLVSHIDQQGLGEETLILVMADNGAVGVNANNINSNGPFRGTKGDLFEGGMREPLIARWTGSVAANRTDTDTVIWMPDLFPTLTHIAGVANPAGVAFDGENLNEALLGNQSQTRSSSLFWNMNRGTENRHVNPNSAGAGGSGREVVAIRNGNWKLLLDARGAAPELYDVSNDLGETNNLVLQYPTVAKQLASEALALRYSMPSRTLPDAVTPLVRLKAEDLASLGNGAAVSSWSDTATGDSFNGSVSQSDTPNRPTLLTNVLNGRAVVSFDGNNSLISSSSNSLPQSGNGLTVFAVTTGDNSGDTAQRLGQIGKQAGTGSRVVGLDVSKSETSTSNGGAGFRFNNGAALYDTPLVDEGFHIVAWQIPHGEPYANATMFVDGTLPANTFTGASTNSTSTTNLSGSDLELILGTGRAASGNLLGGDYFTGQLADFLVFNEQLTIGQINLVANYLSTEYGLPFAYETNLKLIDVKGLAWIGDTGNFDSAWNAGDGNGGTAGANTDPFSGGTQDLYLGNGGVANFSDATNTSASTKINSLRIGTARPDFIVTGTIGNGTLNATGSKSLTIGNGSTPASGAETGDLTVGEAGQTGTVNWNSSGTLKVEGRLRVGEGGIGIFNQQDGVVTAGDVGGAQKFIAIGSGIGSSGTYNLENGRLMPGGGITGSQLRHTRIGYNGGTGMIAIGDGVGAANSASFESRDDLNVGQNGGSGLLTLQSDGQVLLVGNNATVSIGLNTGSVGNVIQSGGTFKSDADFTIGENGGTGLYEIHGGVLQTANDGAAAMRIGRNGGNGTLRVAGTGTVTHPDTLTLGDGGIGTQGRIELVGSQAALSIAKLANLPNGASETIRWIADAAGVIPIVINGTTGSNRVQLQNPTELAANTGTNGLGDLHGDGTALELDLTAITTSMTLTLIDNQTPQPVVGFFEDGETTKLFEEGQEIYGTGFHGTVTISYIGGTGNNVVLNLVADPTIAGDHNGDGIVDAADYVLWRKSGGGNSQGYHDWRTHFGSMAPGHGASPADAGDSIPVPEPTAWIIAIFGLSGFKLRSVQVRGSRS